MNTIPPNDYSYYEMLNGIVQQRPAGSLDPEGGQRMSEGDRAAVAGLFVVASATRPAEGVLGRIVAWYVDPDDPAQEIAQAELVVPCCPFCGDWHRHGWRLDGTHRGEARVSHCGNGEYRVRLGQGVARMARQRRGGDQ